MNDNKILGLTKNNRITEIRKKFIIKTYMLLKFEIWPYIVALPRLLNPTPIQYVSEFFDRAISTPNSNVSEILQITN